MGGGQVPQNCVKVSDLVKLPPPDLHRAAFVGLGTADSFFPVWDVGAEENSEVSLALSTFFWPFTGLSYPFFYMENLAFLVGVSRKAEKSDFFPSKTYVCGFISQMTEDLEMGPVLLRLISASQEL